MADAGRFNALGRTQQAQVSLEYTNMGATLWVHTLEGRQLTSHQEDHSVMSKLAPKLDRLSKSIGVAPVSSFFDYTDASANMSEEEEDSEDEELDPETGWSYGIDDMTWFSAKEGLSTLSAIRDRLTEGATDSVPRNDLPDLLAELESCISKLQEPASRDARFHLAVVM